VSASSMAIAFDEMREWRSGPEGESTARAQPRIRFPCTGLRVNFTSEDWENQVGHGQLFLPTRVNRKQNYVSNHVYKLSDLHECTRSVVLLLHYLVLCRRCLVLIFSY
jgi:hypothetical protein